jgi:hypothetical protein
MAYDVEQVETDAVFLSRAEVKWGKRERDDGSTREAGKMLMCHYIAEGSEPREAVVADEMVTEVLALSPMDRVHLVIEVTARKVGSFAQLARTVRHVRPLKPVSGSARPAPVA